MASYFDVTLTPTASADYGYLPAPYAEANSQPVNLVLYASAVEADVIAFYTEQDRLTRALAPNEAVSVGPGRTALALGDGRAVYLTGYTVDANDCESAAFLVAMKRTIAEGIVWRVEQEGRNLAATAESSDRGKSKSWREDHDAPFPRHWTRHLRPFDSREPAWGV